jgi:hypothetical protein
MKRQLIKLTVLMIPFFMGCGPSTEGGQTENESDSTKMLHEDSVKSKTDPEVEAMKNESDQLTEDIDKLSKEVK